MTITAVCAGSEWVSRQVWGSLTANDLSQRLSEEHPARQNYCDPFSWSHMTSSKLKLTEPCLRVNRTDVVMCSESSSHLHSHNVLHMSREAKSNDDDDDEREKGRVGAKEEGGYRPDKIKKGVEEPDALTLARRVESRIFRGACWLPEVAVVLPQASDVHHTTDGAQLLLILRVQQPAPLPPAAPFPSTGTSRARDGGSLASTAHHRHCSRCRRRAKLRDTTRAGNHVRPRGTPSGPRGLAVAPLTGGEVRTLSTRGARYTAVSPSPPRLHSRCRLWPRHPADERRCTARHISPEPDVVLLPQLKCQAKTHFLATDH
ncbi:hypothetical protein C0Q70_19638 [Pomacea canaliculata]|uniref:Uncharacterized protein n=1 Tax=Pomacea canaliculata TaxID=400727 RepID=A0A2T7NJW4_POMCA|nr:hypothetical protein C0Q70_19638 [Pomacea canaliculata]